MELFFKKNSLLYGTVYSICALFCFVDSRVYGAVLNCREIVKSHLHTDGSTTL